MQTLIDDLRSRTHHDHRKSLTDACLLLSYKMLTFKPLNYDYD